LNKADFSREKFLDLINEDLITAENNIKTLKSCLEKTELELKIEIYKEILSI
jgi:hypothetical protein